MTKLSLLILGALLILASPAQADQTAKLKRQLAAAKRTNTTLRFSLAQSRTETTKVNASLDAALVARATAEAATTTCMGERDAAKRTLTFDTASRVSAMNPVDLWPILAAINARFAAAGGSSYTSTSFQGSSFSSYSFDHWSF